MAAPVWQQLACLLCLLLFWQLAAAELPLEDTYLVVLRPGTGRALVDATCAEAEADQYGRFNGLCVRRFSHVINGFAGEVPGACLLACLVLLAAAGALDPCPHVSPCRRRPLHCKRPSGCTDCTGQQHRLCGA